jgi:hypothetical protein
MILIETAGTSRWWAADHGRDARMPMIFPRNAVRAHRSARARRTGQADVARIHEGRAREVDSHPEGAKSVS